MKSGTEFIISMLYGGGAPFSGPIQLKALTPGFLHPFLSTDKATWGVSSIRTVGSGASHTSNCDIPDTPSTNAFIVLDPTFPVECTGHNLSWNTTLYHEPPNIRGFIPDVGTFYFNRPTLQNATPLAWEVGHREGTQMVPLFQPVDAMGDRDAITSPLITVPGKGDRSVDANSRCVTGPLTSPTATPIVVTSLPETTGRPDNIE